LCKSLNRFTIAKVKLDEIHTSLRVILFNIFDNCLSCQPISCPNDDLTTQACKLSHGIRSDSRVSSRNHCVFSGQRSFLGDLIDCSIKINF
jgi:hypothetical protein